MIMACKDYQEMSRATFDPVVIEISCLDEQITDLERVEAESLEGITEMKMETNAVEAEPSKGTNIYNHNYA